MKNTDLTALGYMFETLLLQANYRMLSELWEQNSKHKTHLKISKMMDETLSRLSELEKLTNIKL